MMASQQQQEEGQVQEQPGNPSTNGSKLSLEQLTVQLRSYATQLVQVQRRAYGYGMDDDEDMGNAFGFTIQDILASLTAVKYSIIGKSYAELESLFAQQDKPTFLECIFSFLSLTPEVVSVLSDASTATEKDIQDHTSLAIQLSCGIIETLVLAYPDFGSLFVEFKDSFVNGLRHPMAQVRKLVLDLVLQGGCANSSVLQLVLSTQVGDAMLDCLESDDLDVVSMTMTVLVNISRHDPGLAWLFSRDSVSLFEGLMEVNDLVRFRVYDLFSRIATASPAAIPRLRSSGLLNHLLNELASPDADMLMKLNAMELFGRLASTPAGFALLEEADVVASLLEYMDVREPMSTSDGNGNDLEEEVSDVLADQLRSKHLLRLGAVKFFAKLCDESENLQVEAIYTKYRLLERFESLLKMTTMQSRSALRESHDLQEAIITVLQPLCFTPKLLGFVMQSRPSLIKDVFVELFATSTGDVKIVCLRTLSCIWGGEGDSTEKSECSRELYDQLHHRLPNLLSDLITSARNAFEDHRFAAYAVLQSLGRYTWAVEDMLISPEFFSWALDRNIERSSVGKEWRYAMIQSVVMTAMQMERFKTDTVAVGVLSRAKRYLREGPFYTETEAAVAFESGG